MYFVRSAVQANEWLVSTSCAANEVATGNAKFAPTVLSVVSLGLVRCDGEGFVWRQALGQVVDYLSFMS